MTGTRPAAPLDQAQLADALRPFGESRMLPVAAYLDDDVLAWERRHVFSGWLALGRGEDLARPRMMRAYAAGAAGVLVVRGDDGALRGFENACRHRGHELLPCDGTAENRAIVCPYHAWAYRLDGSLLGAPGFRDAPGFDPEAHPLAPVEIREWNGWLFADRGAATTFEEHVAGLDAILGRYDGAELVTCETHEYDVEANWKVIVENYQECYHCSSIHPELCRISPPDSGDNLPPQGDWVGGSMDLREGMSTMSLDGSSGGATMTRLDEVEQRTVMYLALLPNMLVSLHPDYVMTHLLTPISAHRTRIRCSWAFPRAVAETDGFDPAYAVDFWDLTNRQDWAACESVQRGMQTPGYRPGPLAPAEDGVYDFVTYMARAYRGD
ncbi:MAG TPA: aromatic ring-hydroxylating dioxygenase subunit alpha [Nocardioides sp.]|uniref:aromatic ring-hydroxylating oxygenase subunit alpha n=1 Tax=Nocardioides sp. TaxID=35761 RepID=UPI002CDD7469|nr:aromatic ring-hydroxylating dioxygenase subunit alpha [Nocardioides sp.]HQR27769.1 aromatic ring-hydroxylating dioxygenase subunit alpha [Nocardioides sp.]